MSTSQRADGAIWWLTAGMARTAVDDVRGSPGLVGRIAELRAITDLLDGARQGVSGVLVVDGEPGMGKATLIKEAMRGASGFRTLQVDGVRSERGFAFAALHRLLLPVIDRVAGLPARQRRALQSTFAMIDADPPERSLIGLATLTLLADVAAHAPLLCVIDDAQWLDGESVEIISFVGRRLQADSIVLLVVTRGEPSAFDGLPHLAVSGLATEDARTLLAAVAPSPIDDVVATRIIGATTGSPLAIIELTNVLSREELGGGRRLPLPLPVGARLEGHFLDQVRALPEATRSYLLLAAAEPAGDLALLALAAAALSLPPDAAEPTVRAGILRIEDRVRFRHALIASAVYGEASGEGRRATHRALASVIDVATDREGRAWHLASSVAGPDEAISAELSACADRVHERGGFATEAAFRTRAAELTPDRITRAKRQLAAAQAHLVAGAPQTAAALLALGEPALTDELLRIDARRLEALLHAYTAPGQVPAILLDAAQRLVPLDAGRAAETFGEAIQASLVSCQLTADTTPADIARAALDSGLLGDRVDDVPRLLQAGFATRLAVGYAEAVPYLRRAVTTAASSLSDVAALERWVVFVNHLGMELWDAADATSLLHAEAADERERGALEPLRVTLLAIAHDAMWRGRFADADAAYSEAAAISVSLGGDALSWEVQKVELLAWQGDEARVLTTAELMTGELSQAVGSGVNVNIGRVALAVLHLAHGRYREAFDAAWPLFILDFPAQSNRALPDTIEAAVRCGEIAAAETALGRLSDRAQVAGSDWALGVLARSQALVAFDDAGAEDHYRQALAHFEGTALTTELARTQLLFGEWPRRRRRRVDARSQLAGAIDHFSKMGARAFERRARAELQATGAVARKRNVDTADDLTPQELQVARLAADGETNKEIAGKLYISVATVEYHLRKVYRKLAITRRHHLRTALS